jgi:hypothetical protein
VKRDYETGHRSHKQEPTRPIQEGQAGAGDRPIRLPLHRDELLGLMQDSLEGLALEPGLLVDSGLLEDEVTRG